MISNLESFRPRLRPGRVIPQGSRIVFETDNPYNQVILPMALADLILLCSGQFSVREIVAKIYKKQGAVPFKSILKALHVLHQGGFFANGEELVLNSHLKSWMEPKSTRLNLSWRFGQRIVTNGPSPLTYYAVTLGVLILALFGLQHFPSAPLELAEDWALDHDAFSTVFVILLCTSLLQTLKHGLRATQQLLLTGKAYNVSMRLSIFGAHIHVGNEANDLFENRLYTLMFYVSQILSPWMFAFLGSLWLSPDLLQPILIASMIVTFWELNPFINSDGLKLIQAMILPDNSEVASWHFETSQLIDAISPEQRRIDHEFARICAIWGGVWLVISASVLHEAAISFGQELMKDLSRRNWSSVAAAGAIVIWLVSLYLTIQSLIEIVLVSLVRPHLQWLSHKMNFLRPKRTTTWEPERIAKMIEPLPIFSHFHEEFIQMIIARTEVLEFSKGAKIISMEEAARELFVLLEGQVRVTRQARTGERVFVSDLAPVSVFGEAALVDDAPRTTEVVAKSSVLALKVPVHVIRDVAKESQSIRQLDDFRNAILVNQFFASSPVFRSLSQESIDFLSSRGTLEYFDKAQMVFQQGDSGDALYLILRGTVNVDVHGTRVKRLYQGSFFGEISMIASIPRTASISTAEPCVFFKISSDSFWEVLVQHMDLGVFLETISETRLKEDLELASFKNAAGDS